MVKRRAALAALLVPLAASAWAGQSGHPVVEQGPLPKSIVIPGTDLSLAIGGYVKVDFIQDFDPIGDAYEFKVNSIAIEGTSAAAQSGRTTIHARETRFNVDLRSHGTDTRRFRAFVEGDFYGDGNAFRMRHAFGEFGPLLGGQTWSTFQDISARPQTIDFEGPDGEVFLRQAMIRYTRRIDANWSVAVAAETPTPQFAVPSGLAGSPRSTMPDLPGFVRYQRGTGHVQVAGLMRQLRFDSTDTDADNTSVVGWGLNTTFVVPIIAPLKLLGQFAIGEGTGRYIEGISGQNVDAVLTASGELRGLRTQAGNIGIVHQMRPNLKTGISYSTASVADDEALTDTTIKRIQDLRFNLIYTPYRFVDLGGEVLWGERRNMDGSKGHAWRFQFAVIYRLS